jgi:hypothetical protein
MKPEVGSVCVSAPMPLKYPGRDAQHAPRVRDVRAGRHFDLVHGGGAHHAMPAQDGARDHRHDVHRRGRKVHAERLHDHDGCRHGQGLHHWHVRLDDPNNCGGSLHYIDDNVNHRY